MNRSRGVTSPASPPETERISTRSPATAHQGSPSAQRQRHPARTPANPTIIRLSQESCMATRKGPIRVLHYGLGPIGAAVVRQVAVRRGFRIVGAVDIDPAKVGRDLGEVANVGRALRVKVSNDPKRAIKASRPDVVVLCTQSSMKKVMPQMDNILKLDRKSKRLK